MEVTDRKTLCKDERLHGNKRIDQLFSSGESFISYPFRVVFVKREIDDTPVSMMISVSKRKFKRAVKRNRMKRLTREAFRLNKILFHNLCCEYNTGLDIAFLYLKNELSEFNEVEKAMLKTIATLTNKLKESKTNAETPI